MLHVEMQQSRRLHLLEKLFELSCILQCECGQLTTRSFTVVEIKKRERVITCPLTKYTLMTIVRFSENFPWTLKILKIIRVRDSIASMCSCDIFGISVFYNY